MSFAAELSDGLTFSGRSRRLTPRNRHVIAILAAVESGLSIRRRGQPAFSEKTAREDSGAPAFAFCIEPGCKEQVERSKWRRPRRCQRHRDARYWANHRKWRSKMLSTVVSPEVKAELDRCARRDGLPLSVYVSAVLEGFTKISREAARRMV